MNGRRRARGVFNQFPAKHISANCIWNEARSAKIWAKLLQIPKLETESVPEIIGGRQTDDASPTENEINLSAEVTAVAHLEEPASQLAGWLNRADGAAEMYVI